MPNPDHNDPSGAHGVEPRPDASVLTPSAGQATTRRVEPDPAPTQRVVTANRIDSDTRDPDGAFSVADLDDAQPDQTSVLRVPTFSPFAPLLGWLVAWGAIATATAILQRVGVPTGLNLGIADGGPGDDGFWAGIWGLIVNGGAFLLGGYAAARIARANGTRHAVLVWVIAMLATGADAIIDMLRNGTEGVVQLIIGVPFWDGTGLTGEGEAILVLAIFAGVSLAGAIIGGGLGQTANRIDRTDDAVVTRP